MDLDTMTQFQKYSYHQGYLYDEDHISIMPSFPVRYYFQTFSSIKYALFSIAVVEMFNAIGIHGDPDFQ